MQVRKTKDGSTRSCAETAPLHIVPDTANPITRPKIVGLKIALRIVKQMCFGQIYLPMVAL